MKKADSVLSRLFSFPTAHKPCGCQGISSTVFLLLPFVFLSSSGMKSCSRPECSFFRDRVFGWQVCPPRRYVWFACNARIVMSQDPAGARIGGDKWSDRSVEKARLGSEFYTGSIEDTRCTTRGLRKAVQWRGLTCLTNGRRIVRKAGIQNPGFRKMHSRSGRVW